ncbi:hypothetical protein LTR56_003679 [Elasticomyces elasticus]|nr:hypothetical protein LTR22_016906 [Elasticomyces elasticus]KAK3655257.1 hypothetical protein LTR56_003679 [Elasticomyces elasticus]KAK4913536.1 hypothetical protein LTR49_018152 [Elasticomyces elasticus]KAK5767263.1 hypothetical protein LTS12_002415 [Elasticomyces elasticus]
MEPEPQNSDSDMMATASLRLCYKPSTTKPIIYHLSPTISPTRAEIDILAALGENGLTYFSTFHEEHESCVVARPLQDLIMIWHPEKIASVVLCVHVHPRPTRLSDEDVRKAEMEWAGEMGDRMEVEGAGGDDPKKHKAGTEKVVRRKSSAGSVADDTATLRITFIRDEGCLLDPGVWRNVELPLPLTARFDELPTLMAPAMRKLVKRDKNLFKILQDGPNKLSFKPYFRFRDCRDRYINFDDGNISVETVAGLFPASGRKMVNVVVEAIAGLADTVPERATDAVETYIGGEPRIFRLGKMADEVPTSTKAKAREVPHEMMITGSFNDEDGFSLGAVPVFSVNGLLIADCYTGVGIDLKESYQWAEKYDGASTEEGLASLVRAHRHDKIKPSMQLPLRPNYSFRAFNPKEHKLGVSRWPAAGVHLTVKCANMLPDSAIITFPALSRLKYTLEAVDNVDSVKTMIREEMRGRSKDGRTCGMLFGNDMIGRWEVMLFVLPQIDKTATLFRWTEGGAMQFLRPVGSSGKADGRLYVEAHIVEAEGAVIGQYSAADEAERASESLFV